MGTIRIERTLGPALVQDLGRRGYARFGVPPSGAADPLSLRVGNRLVGNPEGATAIEVALAGGTFAFDEPAVAALAGSEFDVWIEEPSGARRGLAPWTSAAVRAGGKIHVGSARGGARAYLCIGGGLDVPRALESASTCPACALGGWLGRPLRVGDAIPYGRGGEPGRALTEGAARALRSMVRRDALRVIAGSQQAWFSRASVQSFHGARFTVSHQSDRAGIRLEGPAIVLEPRRSMVTEGMPVGAVQVPPGGAPIILFVDGPTTGGYPVIAAVIAADLPALAHLLPGDGVRFEEVDLASARDALRAQATLVAGLEIEA